MDLWVRSQNKKCLLKATMFNLDNDENGIYCYSNEDNFCLLGKYATKERALEVLDEIQMHIKKQDTDELLVNSDGIITGQKHYGRVYEMPEE